MVLRQERGGKQMSAVNFGSNEQVQGCILGISADIRYVKRLFAVLFAVAVIWPQVILPYPSKESACTNCKCPMLCCSSDAAPSEPLALPAPNVFSSVQWSVPQQTVIFQLPSGGRLAPRYADIVLFPSATPLFLRNCVQLI